MWPNLGCDAGADNGGETKNRIKISGTITTKMRHCGFAAMSDVTQILTQIEQGDSRAADQLLPLVYDELRRLAAAKLARENPGQTLQATALVHEAYVRLVGGE